jgi:hypothetical protein
MESQIVFWSCHVVTKLHVKFFQSFIFVYFHEQIFLTPFAMMYMFVYCICIIYINAHIHQNLNFEPKTSWLHTVVLSTKPFQNFMNKEKKSLILLCLA